MHLVRTRVLVRFTKLFWKDWGLLHVFERIQNSARRRRQVQPAIINSGVWMTTPAQYRAYGTALTKHGATRPKAQAEAYGPCTRGKQT